LVIVVVKVIVSFGVGSHLTGTGTAMHPNKS